MYRHFHGAGYFKMIIGMCIFICSISIVCSYSFQKHAVSIKQDMEKGMFNSSYQS